MITGALRIAALLLDQLLRCPLAAAPGSCTYAEFYALSDPEVLYTQAKLDAITDPVEKLEIEADIQYAKDFKTDKEGWDHSEKFFLQTDENDDKALDFDELKAQRFPEGHDGDAQSDLVRFVAKETQFVLTRLTGDPPGHYFTWEQCKEHPEYFLHRASHDSFKDEL